MFMRPMSSESRRQPLMMMPCQPFLVPMSAAARALALVDKGLQPRGTSGCWASTAVAPAGAGPPLLWHGLNCSVAAPRLEARGRPRSLSTACAPISPEYGLPEMQSAKTSQPRNPAGTPPHATLQPVRDAERGLCSPRREHRAPPGSSGVFEGTVMLPPYSSGQSVYQSVELH